MESTFWYLIAFASIFLLSLILWLLGAISPNLHSGFLRHVAYPLLIQRRRLWDSVTRLEAILIAVFLIGNLLVIFAPFKDIDWRQVERRAAFAAGVNAVPLCLGGRMGPIVQTLNIHRSSYLLFHHWVGRVAVLEAVSHAVIVISRRPTPGPLVTSGWVAFGGFLGACLFSFWFSRLLLGRWFLLSHRAITLTGVSALFWHALRVSKLRAQALVGLCCVMWVVSTFLRLHKLLFYRLSGEVTEKLEGRNATKIEVSLKYPIRVPAGSYFNVFFPGRLAPYNLLYSFPAVAFWHPPDEDNYSGKVSNVSFLFSHRSSHLSALAKLEKGQRILLDGPLGQDLGLSSYENVLLLAKGIGIVGVLPIALELAERRRHDTRIKSKIDELLSQQQRLRIQQQEASLETRSMLSGRIDELARERNALSQEPLFRDAMKQIEVFWYLENNSQMDWVEDQLRALQKLDPENNFMVVWCGYPCPRMGEPPFKLTSRHWMCLEPAPGRKPFDELFISKIKEERKRLQGHMLVSTCGDPSFTAKVRKGAVDSIGDMGVTFVETEYRPYSVDALSTSETALHDNLRERAKQLRRQKSQDLEMRNLTARSSYGSSYSVQLN